MIQIAGVLLQLPDGRIVLNRRGKTAPVSAGLLALYGGHMEKAETPVEAAARELTEETSIKFQADDLKPLLETKVLTEGVPRYFYIFELDISDANFEVYEGDGSEIYTIEEALSRNDLSASSRKALVIKAKNNGA